MRAIQVYTGGAGTSATVYPLMKFDEDGVVHITHNTAGLSVQIQGRLNPALNWVNLRLDAAGTTVNTSSAYYLIPLFPEMQAVVTGASGNVTIYIGD